MFMRQQSDPREVRCLIFGTHSKLIGEPRLKHAIFYLQNSPLHLIYLGRLCQKNTTI